MDAPQVTSHPGGAPRAQEIDRSRTVCFQCGQLGHLARACVAPRYFNAVEAPSRKRGAEAPALSDTEQRVQRLLTRLGATSPKTEAADTKKTALELADAARDSHGAALFAPCGRGPR